MSVRFVVDSGADLTAAERQALGVDLVPLRVIFPEGEYLDGVDITPQEFYEKMAAHRTLPTTSMASAYDFETALAPIMDRGEEAVVLTISGKLSGTVQSAHIAAENWPGRVFVVDSLNITAGIRIQLEYGMRLAREDLGGAEIARRIEAAQKNVRLTAVLDTLENLKKGGRISPAVAFAGGVLGIKPVVRVHDGQVDILGKARGMRHGWEQLAQAVRDQGDIDFSMPAYLAYTGTDRRVVDDFLAVADGLWDGKLSALPVCHAGSCIGTHAGPGVVAVCCYAKEPAL